MNAGAPAVAVREPAPAKLNLFLRVTGRRPDGYHLLDSLAVFAGAHDVVQAEPGHGIGFTLTGPFSLALAGDHDNLVLRAGRALADVAGGEAGATLLLEKHLPVASGIGGGSADAAACLRALCRLWRIHPPDAVLHPIALSLGADVPVCLGNAPTRMSGIGEVLGAAPILPEYGLVLVNPGVPVATPAVFRAREGAFSPPAALPASWPDAATMAADLRTLGNDLQAPAIALCPPIATVLAAIAASPGCLLAQMSGSGATCFGLYPSAAAARAAAATLRHAGWWVWAGAPWS